MNRRTMSQSEIVTIALMALASSHRAFESAGRSERPIRQEPVFNRSSGTEAVAAAARSRAIDAAHNERMAAAEAKRERRRLRNLALEQRKDGK